jgi:hypothetical protein
VLIAFKRSLDSFSLDEKMKYAQQREKIRVTKISPLAFYVFRVLHHFDGVIERRITVRGIVLPNSGLLSFSDRVRLLLGNLYGCINF